MNCRRRDSQKHLCKIKNFLMKTVERTEIYSASPEKVFKVIDNLGVTGMHMTQSSAMLMGSKLNLEFLTENHSGLGCRYRWRGKMLGMRMDFTVEVTKWTEGREKIWETDGDAKLIILSWYRMHIKVSPMLHGAQAKLSISYKKPKSFFNKILSFFFAGWYCRWCLRKMFGDARKSLNQLKNEKSKTLSTIF